MRLAPIALVVALLPLAGCLEDEAALARVDEMRIELDEAQAQVANMTAEARGWRDATEAERNESGLLRAQRSDLYGLYNVSQEQRELAEAQRAQRDAELERTRADLDAARVNVTALEARVALDTSAESLARRLDEAKAQLARTQMLYDAALGEKFDALTSIERGNVTAQWTDLRGDARSWTYSLEDYRQDVKRVRPGEYVTFTTASGKGIRVADPRPYLDTEPFNASVQQITDGRTDREFVREVFRMKTQIVDYSFSLIDEKGYYKYPGETLVEGTGVCGDTTILLASVLAAGNAQAQYGLELALWVVDLDEWTGQTVPGAQTVDHALLEVKFRDGTVWYVETTSYEFRLHEQVHGWRFAWV